MINHQLSKEVHELLLQKQATLATAESCTAGLISATLADNPGSSVYLLGGIISYSNEVKEKFLGVSEKTLNTQGAVSQETALEMITGVKSKFNPDIAISVTGIAGPEGGDPNKPVGTVFFGLSYDGKDMIFNQHFTGDRQEVRSQSVNFILSELKKVLSATE